MANFGKLNFNISLKPTSAFPLDARCYFDSFTEAEAAAATAEEVGSTNTIYYFGQKLVVVTDGTATWYTIQPDKTLKVDGSGSGGNIGGGGDMLKEVYDTNGNGKVDKADDADKFGGQLPEYYAKQSELFSGSYNDLTDKPTDFAPTEHTHEISEVNGLQDELDDMVAVAQGKCASYVFETVDELDTWLTKTENTTKLKIGDVFLIKAVNVPDYWWDGSTKQILETTKVDLTSITNSEIDTIVAS